MRTLWELLVAGSIMYFVVINLHYTVLIFLSFFRGFARVRQVEVTNVSLLHATHLTPPVSLLIPAYNEERGVVNTVYSALKLEYPEHEIIVINDHSSDRTLRVLIETFAMHTTNEPYRATIPTAPVRRIYRSARFPNLTVIDKDRGGKADALNAGTNLARFPYVCNTDADTIFERDALVRIIRPVLDDPERVVAVGGQVRVGNGFRVEQGEIVERQLPRRLLPTFQILEYLRTFIANRVGWSSMNAMLLISGAFGLWSRSVLIEAGGFSVKTSGEDLELTLRFHNLLRARKKPYRIISLPDPIAWTEVPSELPSFIRQRNRWHRVMLESVVAHRNMLLNPAHGGAGMLGMPALLLFEIIGPFIECFSYIVVALAWLVGVIDISFLGLFLCLSVGYTTAMNISALIIEDLLYGTFRTRVTLRLLLFSALDNLGYRQFTMLIRIIATFDWLTHVRSWGRIERYGFYSPQAPVNPRAARTAADAPEPEIVPTAGWQPAPELRDQPRWFLLAGRLALLLLAIVVLYLGFVQFTHWIFAPRIEIAGIIPPTELQADAPAHRAGLRVRNTRFFQTGAGYTVAVIDGETEVEGPVVEIPPREVRELPVNLNFPPGRYRLSFILYDAWADNVRRESRSDIAFQSGFSDVTLDEILFPEQFPRSGTVTVSFTGVNNGTMPETVVPLLLLIGGGQTAPTELYGNSGLLPPDGEPHTLSFAIVAGEYAALPAGSYRTAGQWLLTTGEKLGERVYGEHVIIP